MYSRVITTIGPKYAVVFFQIGTFLKTCFTLGIGRAHKLSCPVQGGLRRSGGNISVHLS